MAGPPEPISEASHYGIHGDTMTVNKQMYFANAHEYFYMNMQDLVQYTVKLCKNFVNITLFQLVFVCVPTSTFTFVKVSILNLIERLLIRNHALCLILPFGAQFSVVFFQKGRYYSVVFVKKGSYYGLKSIVFIPVDLKVS